MELYENANIDNIIMNVYGTNIDIQNAERILGTKWYNYIQTDQSGFIQPYSFSSNDIILGNSEIYGGIGSVDLNGGIRIDGSDCDTILNSLISYVGTRNMYGLDQDIKTAQCILKNNLFNYVYKGDEQADFDSISNAFTSMGFITPTGLSAQQIVDRITTIIAFGMRVKMTQSVPYFDVKSGRILNIVANTGLLTPVEGNAVNNVYYFDVISGRVVQSSNLKLYSQFSEIDLNLTYVGTWATATPNVGYTGGTAKITSTVNSEVKFNFSGTSFQFLSYRSTSSTNNVNIKIDGIDHILSLAVNSNIYQEVVYSTYTLENKEHYVEIINLQAGTLIVDAIAIDNNCILKPYNNTI